MVVGYRGITLGVIVVLTSSVRDGDANFFLEYFLPAMGDRLAAFSFLWGGCVGCVWFVCSSFLLGFGPFFD